MMRIEEQLRFYNGPGFHRIAGGFRALGLLIALATALPAGETTIGSHTFTLPDGFEIELIAGPPLVDRPITAAFDEQGRLYVADSSGSNDPVKKQIEEKPHRILRLEDADGDGKFEKSTVFADKMMFPEGTMFYDGSLYVSAPPTIWKLTDTNGDGVADERVEWFDGKTLTGCANDLHGPYLGPDGFIYWCKGAFAEQNYTINSKPWKTKAAHIFRCKPDGSELEAVMTGGMDNPVDTVFLPDGERVFSTTFLVFPGNGQRDGLLHAVYGGVYGKEWGTLEGHPRTGEVMPVLTHMGPAAPCGLTCYESQAFGPDYVGSLFACQFNMHKVSHHLLIPTGATYQTADTDFVVSNNHDFHPTDVIEDADGSLIVVDTGGWYKLCCPTSQLHKPDILGGIYRVKKTGAKKLDDPRGLKLDWAKASAIELWKRLLDERPAVRQRTAQALHDRRESAEVKKIVTTLLEETKSPPARASEVRLNHKGSPTVLAMLWTLVRIDSAEARELIRLAAANHPWPDIRQAALHAISLHRDELAKPTLVALLHEGEPANRRIAAEALGRIGDRSVIPDLLKAVGETEDRVLEHSLIYALIELDDKPAIEQGISSENSRVRRAALIALDQMPHGGLTPNQVVPLLASQNEIDLATANWILKRHADWGDALAGWFAQQLSKLPPKPTQESDAVVEQLESQLATFTGSPAIQQLLATVAGNGGQPTSGRQLSLRMMARTKVNELPTFWADTLANLIATNSVVLPEAVLAARALPATKEPHPALIKALANLGDDADYPYDVRLNALAAIPTGLTDIEPEQFDMILTGLAVDNPIGMRSASADILAKATLSDEQLARLCDAVKTVGPLELDRVLGAFAQSTSEPAGRQLLAALETATSLASLRIDSLRQKLEKYSPDVRQKIDRVESLVNVDAATQRARIEDLLTHVKTGDVRRGQAVFNNTKSACIVCHRFGYVGGNTGPDLTRIGKIRQERDLLESILYPSLSFVRSYEPVVITTVDGKVVNGLIRNETADELLLATGPNKEERVRRADIDEIRPSTVSIMPAGLDKQLSTQELIDLVAFLKNAQ